MKISRFVSLTDIVVVIVVAVVLFLPPRPLSAQAVPKVDEAGRTALAFAEARVVARPGDGDAVYDLAHRLAEAKQSDWAVQAAAVAAAAAPTAPMRWRALLAVAIAHVDRFEPKEGLEFANQALAACEQSGGACPSWEALRVELYQRHLAAGVRSGIDPRQDPVRFREAGEAALRQVRTTGSGIAPAPPPAPAPPAP